MHYLGHAITTQQRYTVDGEKVHVPAGTRKVGVRDADLPAALLRQIEPGTGYRYEGFDGIFFGQPKKTS